MRAARLEASQSLWYLTQTTCHAYLVIVQPENRDPALEQNRVWNVQAQANALVLEKGWAGGSGAGHVGGRSGEQRQDIGAGSVQPGTLSRHTYIHEQAVEMNPWLFIRILFRHRGKKR